MEFIILITIATIVKIAEYGAKVKQELLDELNELTKE
jgi:hypothetical protein